MPDPEREAGASTRLQEVLFLTLRALRQPQAGLAGILSVAVAEAGASLGALYLVPMSSERPELLASAGLDALSLGMPGPAAENATSYLRERAAQAGPPSVIGSAGLPVPWAQHPYVGSAAGDLPNDQRAVLLLAGPERFPSDLLATLIGPLSVLAGILSSSSREEAILRELHGIRQEGALLAAGLQHDLRTPLTSILGCAQTLKGAAGLDEKRRTELLDIIVDQSRRLNDMITEALDRHAEGPDVPVRLVPADVEELSQRVAAAARMARGGEVVVDVSAVKVVTDERRLERALLNLVDNAIKYSPAGKAVHVLGEGTPVAYTLTIADAGPGVSAEMVSALFTPFATDPQRTGGTGLGLHSAAALIREIGGHVSYARRSGWTRFSVTLPREPASPPPDPPGVRP